MPINALFSTAKRIGLDTNAAALSANQAVVNLTGTNILALLGQTHDAYSTSFCSKVE